MLELLRKTSISNFTVGIVAALISLATPTLLLIEIGHAFQMSQANMVSWLFGSFFFASLIGLFLAWRSKQPINVTMSVPAAVFVGASLHNFTLETASFGYACSGILLVLIGIFKLYDRIMGFIKLEIIFAMFGGTMIQYSLNLVFITAEFLFYGSIAIITYLLAMRFFKLIPPVIIVILVLTVILGFEGAIPFEQLISSTWISPEPFMWTPSWSAFFSLSIPLTLIALSAELTIGISILRTEKYQPPVHQMTGLSGAGLFLGSFFGAHSVTTSGVPIGILADPSAGPKQERYIAALWASIFGLLFGVFAHYIIQFFIIYPQEILRLFVGLTLIPIIIKALTQAFGSGRNMYGAFTSFIISLSGLSILKIGAPFWAIIIGMLVSAMVEKPTQRD